MTTLIIITGIAVTVAVVSSVFIFDARMKLKRYAKITDIEEHLTIRRQQVEHCNVELEKHAATIEKSRKMYASYAKVLGKYKTADEVQRKINALQTDYDKARAAMKAELERLNVVKFDAESYQQLKNEIAALQADTTKIVAELRAVESQLVVAENNLEMQSFGVYDRLYDYEDPQQYRERMNECVAKQKNLVKDGGACSCSTEWQVDGDYKKGKKMIDEQIKLMLRGFNGECDAAISRVKHANFAQQEKKIRSTFDTLNKLGKTKQVSLSAQYRDLKIRELRLTHELALARQEEKEREREIREQMREEAKAQKEIETAKKKAEEEEAQKLSALEAARKELADEHGKHNEQLALLVAKLEGELSEAIDRKAKAIARAQLTRSGHVYVLSNIGTMGERVYKIGMTRRLIPDERVKELGDASVPFPFDVHAMIYSEDAPTLEKAIHQHFDACRVNKVNTRKEYFRTTLDQIRAAVANLHTGAVTFVVDHPAEQYRESESIANQNRQSQLVGGAA